jgi:two-component system, response regulator RegA
MTEAWRILIVDDDMVFAETLAGALTRRGYSAEAVLNGDAAMALARQHRFEAAVIDLRIATESGLHLIGPLKEIQPELRIVLLTGFASITTAVEAIKLGATHYLSKPATVDEILAALGRTEGDAEVEPAEAPLSVDRLEWEHIQKVLGDHDGNISSAARALKMHRRTLQRKLAKKPARN